MAGQSSEVRARKSRTEDVLENTAEMVRDLVLPGGKALKVVNIKNSALYGVVLDGSGSIPDDLDARWTSASLAYDAARAYVQTKHDEFIKQRTT